MTALEDAVAALQQAVADANNRFQNVGELQNALDAERAQYDALVVSEDAEDVQQNEELNNAKAQTDAALQQLATMTQVLGGITDQVNNLGRTVTDETTVGGDTPTPAESGGTPPPTGDTPTPTPDAGDTPAPDPGAAEAPGGTVAPDNTDPNAQPAPDDAGTAPDPATPDGTTTTPVPLTDGEQPPPAEQNPVDTGAAPDQVADEPATDGASVVDNTPAGADPTDITNMRPNL